jgi:hypothetical protein
LGFNGDLYPTAGASSVMTTTGDLVRYDSERERYGIGSTNQVLTVVGGLPAWASAGHVTQSRALEVACSDEGTALTTADNPKITFRMPYALTLNQGEAGLRASLTGVGSTSGTTTVDVHMNGTTIMSSTKCTIDYGDDTSVGASAEPVITTLALTDNAEITVEIDAVTGGADETGLKIQLIGTLA